MSSGGPAPCERARREPPPSRSSSAPTASEGDRTVSPRRWRRERGLRFPASLERCVRRGGRAPSGGTARACPTGPAARRGTESPCRTHQQRLRSFHPRTRSRAPTRSCRRRGQPRRWSTARPPWPSASHPLHRGRPDSERPRTGRTASLWPGSRERTSGLRRPARAVRRAARSAASRQQRLPAGSSRGRRG